MSNSITITRKNGAMKAVCTCGWNATTYYSLVGAVTHSLVFDQSIAEHEFSHLGKDNQNDNSTITG